MTPNGQSDPSLDKAAIREPLPADAGRFSFGVAPFQRREPLLQPICAMIKPFGFAVLWIWHPSEVSALSGWFDAAFSLINSGWNKPAEPLFFRFCR